MKKHLYLLICIAINLALFAGCNTYSNNTSAVVTEKPLSKTISSESPIITNWKPTAYETVNNFAGVTMTVNKEAVSSTKLTLAFKNNSNSQCIYGDYFELEKKITGRWYQVPVTIDGNYGFNAVGYNLASGDASEKVVDWNWLYGSLDAGEYRIVKDISDFRGTGDYDTYYLAAEFTIY
jgi:hypothetical protein